MNETYYREHVATAAQFEDALIKLARGRGIAKYELAIFQAFSDAPANTLTQTSLAARAGFRNGDEANMRLGQLAHAVSDALHFEPHTKYSDGFPRWWPTLAFGSGQDEHGHWQWTIRPELLEVLRKNRWVRS